jgi:hypothetical protein
MAKLIELGIEPAEIKSEEEKNSPITFRVTLERREKLQLILKRYCINQTDFFNGCIDQVHTKMKSRKASGS